MRISRKNFRRLKRTGFFILDMDGTFYLGDGIIEGAAEFLDFIKGKGIGYVFLTNNSSSTRLSPMRNCGSSATSRGAANRT